MSDTVGQSPPPSFEATVSETLAFYLEELPPLAKAD